MSEISDDPKDKLFRLCYVFNRIGLMCETDEHVLNEFVLYMDNLLDDLQSEDMFGTEGQCDPRGDFRDGEFSIRHKIML